MKIIYWSSTGNTEAMAELIRLGAEECGKNPELINISNESNPSIEGEDIIVLGCPAMGNEGLDEGEFRPFIESVSDKFKDKKVVLFGSYGWGTGEWMEKWEEEMKGYGANLIEDSLIVNYEPCGEDRDQCIELGRKLAKMI